jgi:hypothetical protein
LVADMSDELDFDLIGEVDAERIPGLYETGQLSGVYCDPQEISDFVAELSSPIFGIAAPELMGTGEGRVSTPYRAIMKYDPDFGRYEPQTTGDCVSHATRNAGMMDYGVDIAAGVTAWRGRFATENIYGARGHGGQGASCARLAKYVHQQHGWGGFLVRKEYCNDRGDCVDLSKYNSRLGHNWGRRGTPDWLNNFAKGCPAVTVSFVGTIEEARDAIANGYGISVCSGYGFSSRRDSNGVSNPRGRWAHAMAWIGCDDSDWAHQKFGGPIFLVQNSWGAWNSGPKRHDQPDGSFWIKPGVARNMLSARGSWVISSVVGFKRRKLDFLLI